MVEITADDYNPTLDDFKREFKREQPSVVLDGGGEGEDFLRVLKRQHERLTNDIEQLYDQLLIETATGEFLERLGLKYNVERQTGESNEKLRKRMYARRDVANSRGTYKGIAQLAMTLFDADPHEVSVLRPSDTNEMGTAEIQVPQQRFDNAPFTKSEIGDLLSDAAIGGHRIRVAEANVFRFGDPDNGFGTEWGQTIN